LGVYNPHLPQVLGQEWVPIRDEDVIFSPAVNQVELGHRFTFQSSHQFTNGRFYLNDPAPAQVQNQVYMMSVYPLGTAASSGPVRRCVIPCNAGGVTGSASFNGLAAASIPIFLANPSDGDYIECTPNFAAGYKALDLFFATNAYAPLLAGKRILRLSLLHSFSWDPNQSGVPGSVAPDVQQYTLTQALTIQTGAGAPTDVTFSPFVETYGNSLVAMNPPRGKPPQAIPMSVVNFGEVNHRWATPSTAATTERVPWRYEELQRFEATAGSNRYRVHYEFGDITEWAGVFYLNYAALEVLFCEEQRVVYGGKAFGGSIGDTRRQQYTLGANILPLRDRTLAANPTLPAGDYELVISSPDIGDIAGPFISGSSQPASANTYPDLNGLRQLYHIPPHHGVKVNVTQEVGSTFSEEETDVLPQLSLHTDSGAPLTEVHAYGRQSVAQVYGSIIATQDIRDSSVGGARTWPWVRFYARRFGSTTVPLRLDSTTITGAGVSVQVTPVEWDALDEIIDGWKEVTLRFSLPPAMGAPVNPVWRWSATGELAGNRWEVLGATAPAISGTPGNMFNTVPSGQLLSSATYGEPSGATINEAWVPQYAPPVTAVSDDQTSDATLIFAQDMAPVTGFAVSVLSQAITGIGQDCGVNPGFIPSTLSYNRLTWGLPVNTGIASDNFNRIVAAGSWGTASDGKTWALGTQPAADMSVDQYGFMNVSTRAIDYLAWLNTGGPNQDITVDIRIGDVSEGTGSLRAGVAGRLTNATNLYFAEARYTETGVVELRVSRRVAGVATTLVTLTLGNLLPSPAAWRRIRFQLEGIFLRAKLWDVSTEEPEWQIVTTDSNLTTGNNAGTFVRDDSTAAGPTLFSFDNFSVEPPDFNFGFYELQRQDPLAGWQAIMMATGPAVTGFSDFEARVGLQSDYRIRAVDVYQFPGPWSLTVSATIPAPGVTGTLIGANSHVLVFTTNERQNGSRNLAYCTAWEGSVEEGFIFPEAGTNQLQPMFNRDFFTAFRPMERGGEQFTRTLLVQAAAISPETLANFTSLRDMAWENVSYICVRDEDGNRWLASITIPDARVLRDRRLYLASVGIAEVTDTPSPVNPS
jgi:hypothetical protein